MKAIIYILISTGVILLFPSFALAQNIDEESIISKLETIEIPLLKLDSLNVSLSDLNIIENLADNKLNYPMLIFQPDKKVDFTMNIIKPDLTKEYTMKIIPSNPMKPNNKGFKKIIPKKKELPE